MNNQLQKSLSDALDVLDTLEYASTEERSAKLSELLQVAISSVIARDYQWELQDPKVLESAITDVLSRFVAQIDLEVSGKEVLMKMLDGRIRHLVEHEQLSLHNETLLPALTEWWAEESKKFISGIHADKVLQIELIDPAKPQPVNVAKFAVYHYQLESVIKRINAKVPLWIWGSPGSGKNYIALQTATALNLNYYPIHLGPTTTESKLMGYRNASTGEYVPGLLYTPYTEGGLIFMDEIDVADPAVLVATNALISNNEYRFPNGVLAEKHPNVRFLAGANTLGLGATKGFKRNSQDAAARDRWVKLEILYDTRMEAKLAVNNCPKHGAKWAQYVLQARAWVNANSTITLHVTPRASVNGALMLEAGINPLEVVEGTITCEMTPDMRKAYHSKVGDFKL